MEESMEQSPDAEPQESQEHPEPPKKRLIVLTSSMHNRGPFELKNAMEDVARRLGNVPEGSELHEVSVGYELSAGAFELRVIIDPDPNASAADQQSSADEPPAGTGEDVQ